MSLKKKALERFANLMSGDKALLIAHNAQFDLNFLGMTFMRYKDSHPEWLKAFTRADYLDTVTVYKDRTQYPHKLKNAIEHYNLQDLVQNSHRAIDDVKALEAVTEAMQKERADLESYINIFGYNAKYGISGKTLRKVTYHSQSFRKYIAPEDATLPEIIKRERRK